jgi:hypothetical protein
MQCFASRFKSQMFGWLNLKARRNGPEVWVLRHRETLANGRRRAPRVVIGTVKEYPSTGELACSRGNEGGNRPHRLAHIPA